jgi:hypothetical protein
MKVVRAQASQSEEEHMKKTANLMRKSMPEGTGSDELDRKAAPRPPSGLGCAVLTFHPNL